VLIGHCASLRSLVSFGSFFWCPFRPFFVYAERQKLRLNKKGAPLGAPFLLLDSNR